MKGKLIVFEGVEGCGKTTQIKRTEAWLLENPVVQYMKRRDFQSRVCLTREPGGTDLGTRIRQILLGESDDSVQSSLHDQAELLLYAADRAQHVQEFLIPYLDQGAIILCDRYTDSTVAYQGYGRGLNLQVIEKLNHIATGGLESDLTLWLDLDAEVGLARTRNRGACDRIEQANLEFHRRVQHGFATLADAYPNRIIRIDAQGTQEDVARQIQSVLEEKLVRWYPALT
ncbi:MAG TPA: dTMP kinase [Elainellaceae cyanobacterium]|jgi:dTMP kinase